jgi:hypothetical protein
MLESSLMAHHRHLHCPHHQRQQQKAPQVMSNNNINETKVVVNKPIDRLRFNHLRTTKMILPLRLN